jgi:hypothetical protein
MDRPFGRRSRDLWTRRSRRAKIVIACAAALTMTAIIGAFASQSGDQSKANGARDNQALVQTSPMRTVRLVRTVNPSFAPSGPIPVGHLPSSVVAADLNGDGRPDLAVANGDSNDVTVLLGNGAGGFSATPGSPVEVRRAPGALVAADLNGDGSPDLTVANNPLEVLLGNGAGGFSAGPGSPVRVAGSPLGITTADLNADGKVDLVVPAYTDVITILLGDGSGRFAPAPGSPIAVGRVPSVAVDDFNGDGKPDLAVADPRKVSILPGSGDGRFGAARTVLAGTGPDFFDFLAAADFNRDGRADLAVTRYASDESTIRLRVLLGNGAGRFRRAAGSPIAFRQEAVGAVADLNGDRKSDLALVDDGLDVLLGNGAGGFRPAADSPFPVPPISAIAPADLNGDGETDLAVTGFRCVPVEEESSGCPQDAVTIMFQTPSTPAAAPGGAFPGRRDAVFSTRGRIERLASDGNRAAVTTSNTKGSCGRVVVWTAPRRESRSFTTYGGHLYGCGLEETRPYSVGQLALGGGQVAWIGVTGGNNVELHLEAAKLSDRAAKEIDFVSYSGDGRGEWVGRLLGNGPLLAFNSWGLVCDDICPPAKLRVVGRELVRISAGRPLVVKRGAGSSPLSAVGGGRMAVMTAGAVTVLAPSGSQVATIPAVEGNPPRGIALSRARLAVARASTLDLYDPATGAEEKSVPLGPAAAMHLAGVNAKVALLRGPRRVVLVRLSNGKQISLHLPLKGTVGASLTAAGLFYAYNIRGVPAKGRIVFEPTGELLDRF